MSRLFSKSVERFLNASAVGQDRIIRKEVSLGTVRELAPPDTHLGLQFAPWLDVPTDDVIFSYIKGDVEGLAPARAQDAESELAQKDDIVYGEGRASLIDWAHKDHYDASDINNYREYLKVMDDLRNGTLPLFVRSGLEDFAGKYARDQARRKRKLDNRINQMIMTGLADGSFAYNDGRINFAVNWGRPASQAAGNAANNRPTADIANGVWDTTVAAGAFDPIKFINGVKDYMEETYGVIIDRALTSKKVLRQFIKSDKFSQRAGLGAAYSGAGVARAPDLNYLLDGWGPDAAVAVVEQATDVQFIVDDSVYRTRPVGSTTVTNNRFFPQNRIVFLPSAESVNEIDDTEIGFAKTLTSPHPEGGWTSGFYEWERETVDPWGRDAGTGVKAFPVFTHMDLTYAVNVTMS